MTGAGTRLERPWASCHTVQCRLHAHLDVAPPTNQIPLHTRPTREGEGLAPPTPESSMAGSRSSIRCCWDSSRSSSGPPPPRRARPAREASGWGGCRLVGDVGQQGEGRRVVRAQGHELPGGQRGPADQGRVVGGENGQADEHAIGGLCAFVQPRDGPERGALPWRQAVQLTMHRAEHLRKAGEAKVRLGLAADRSQHPSALSPRAVGRGIERVRGIGKRARWARAAARAEGAGSVRDHHLPRPRHTTPHLHHHRPAHHRIRTQPALQRTQLPRTQPNLQLQPHSGPGKAP